jgi:hypothetical protein
MFVLPHNLWMGREKRRGNWNDSGDILRSTQDYDCYSNEVLLLFRIVLLEWRRGVHSVRKQMRRMHR